MIRFIYRTGGTPTRKCIIRHIEEDLAAGEQAVLLVPEQETVSVERQMLELLPPAAQLSFEVLNFSRLANRVARRVGGLSHRVASPALSALLMWHTLGELSPFLTQYGTGNAKSAALCDKMLQTHAQCKAYCITSDALLSAADQLDAGDPLREKLTDIGTVLGTYAATLAKGFDDGADDLTRLAEQLRAHGAELFASTHVYIDSFTDFTAQELLVLRALFRVCPSVSVGFPFGADARAGLHLSTATETHRRLHQIAKELSLPVLTEKEEGTDASGDISYLAEHLFEMDTPPADTQPAGVKLYACASPFEEADAAAAHIHRLVRGGCRYRDITVVVRDTAAWAGILDAAFEREGIPCFLSEKTDITVRPLIKLILMALRIRLYGWREEDVIAYLKTGLCGISDDDINLFEAYAEARHPRGEGAYLGAPFCANPDGFKTERSGRAIKILEGANRTKDALIPPLTRFHTALDQARNAREQCAALAAFLADLDIAARLRAEAEERLRASERRDAEELSRLYAITLDAMEEIATAMGDVQLSLAEFADALKLIFSHTDIGVIPTSTDEITVGSASMLRADRPRHVLVLGLCEGQFPQNIRDDGLFGEDEKRRLAAYGLEFPTDNASRASDELFYIHRAFSAPTQGLYLSYATATAEGTVCEPSIAWRRTLALFPKLTPIHYAALPVQDQIFTENGAMEAVAALPAPLSDAVISLLCERGRSAAAALRRPVTEPNAAVSPETAAHLFGAGSFNPTHLEKFAGCRFAYYCSKILRLREPPAHGMSSAEVGTFIHHVLEHIMVAVSTAGGDFAAYDAAKQTEMVADICADYRRELLSSGEELSPRTEALLARLETLAGLIVSSLFTELSDSLFKPVFFELNLAAMGERAEVSAADGTKIPLSGTADRVDLWQDGKGQAYLRVTDYKTGARTFREEEIDKGFDLQMPLYLLSLCRGAHPSLCRRLGLPEDTRFRPAGVNYLSCAVGTENTDTRIPPEVALEHAVGRLSREGVISADPDVQHAISRSGNKDLMGSARSKKQAALTDAEFEGLFDRLERTIARIAGEMKSGLAKAEPVPHGGVTPCEFCSFRAVCRAAHTK